MGYLHPNNNYWVTIGGGPTNIYVIGNAMAKLSLQIENKWVNILEAFGFQASDGAPTGALGTVVSGALIATGNNFTPVFATSHVWRGSTGIELSLDMRFDAVDSTVTDVLENVQTLISAWMPTRSGSWLHPPGPTPLDLAAAYGGVSAIVSDALAAVGIGTVKSNPLTSGGTSFVVPNSFWVQLGNVMVITNLIPTTISWEFENRFAGNGDPVAALMKLNLISYTVPSAEDMLSYFTHQVTLQGTGATPTAGTLPGAAVNLANEQGFSIGGA